MAPGPDGDGDDEELVDIELEEIAGEALAPPRAPPLPARPISAPPAFARPPRPTEPQVPLEAPASPPPAEGEVELGDIVEVRQPIVEAAETDARADRVELESEAAAATEPARRAALLLEVARLVETEGDGERALAAAREAFAADPSLPVTLWGLRRLLSRAGQWQELADAYQTAADAVTVTAGETRGGARARGSLVERGRLLEDRLGRDDDAVASYDAARAADPEHAGALLALLLVGARRQEPAAIASALGGLARRAEGTRRAALAIEEARVWRQSAARARRRGAGAGRADRGAGTGRRGAAGGDGAGRAGGADRGRRAARRRGARAAGDRGPRGAPRSRAGGRAVARAGAACRPHDWTRRRTPSLRSRRRRAWTRRTRSSRRIGCCSSRRWRAARRPMRWRRR